jgi:hypothetical protein
MTLFTNGRTRTEKRVAARYVVSYDLWEEKFSVTSLTGTRKSARHLNAQAAETWCLEQMPLDTTGLSEAEPFWVRLEVRAQQSRGAANVFGRENLSEAGISLNGLVEVFSRPAQTDQPHWSLDAGPFTLGQLRKGRG